MAELVNSYNQVVEIWADVCMVFENKMTTARKRINPNAFMPNGFYSEELILGHLIKTFLGDRYALRTDLDQKGEMHRFIKAWRHQSPIEREFATRHMVKLIENCVRSDLYAV